jgi:predicted TIM-barrel fold metal-dependent hydrolase
MVALDPFLFGPQFSRKEIDVCIKAGAVGLKIVPAFIGVPPNDATMSLVWEEAERRQMPVLSQSGAGTGPMACGHPKLFEEVLQQHPRCKIILAHMGVGAEEEVARLTARYPNLFCDTSTRLARVGQPGDWTLAEAADWFRRIGVDRVLFGSNYPLWDPGYYVDILMRMPLTEKERRQVFSENFQRVFNHL